MTSITNIRARWQLLYRDLVVLETIKKTNPKKLKNIQIKLRDLIMDIDDELKELGLSKSDIDLLCKLLKQCKQYQKIALAA